MVRLFKFLPALCLVALTGCNLAPDYARPQMDVPAEWNAAQSQAMQDKWWERFHDAALNALVEEALAHNNNITAAMAAVDQAQAGLGIARDALLPVPAASVDAGRVMARSATSPIALKNGGKNTHSWSGALAASWTLDFWGKYWNAAEAARSSLVATEAARDNVIISVQAATVEAYFWLSAYTWQEEICASVLASREDELKLYQNRFDNGQISDLDILSIKANVETARQALANARIAKNAAETSLAVLLGRSPAEIMAGHGIKAPASLMKSLPTTPVLPSGIPSELLERRPDIRQAEANLQATNFNIGVARASYFPSFSLTGLLGSASLDLDKLLKSSNAYASLGAGVSLPLNFWTIKRGVDSAEASKRAAEAAYRTTVLGAFKNVRDALVSQEQNAKSVKAMTDEVQFLTKALQHARVRYNNGYASYIELLTTECNLFNAQQGLAAAHAQHLVSIAEVCLALGGGWQDGAAMQDQARRDWTGRSPAPAPQAPAPAGTTPAK